MVWKTLTYDKVKSDFQKFSDGTSLHGYAELFHAKSAFWKITWTIVVVGALIVTGFQVYKAIVQYVEQSSTTLIVPLDSPNLEYPTVGVCFIHWISWVNWTKAYSMNFTKESLLYGFSYLTPIFSPTIFNVTEAEEKFIDVMTNNNISTLSQLYKSLAKRFPLVHGQNDYGGLLVADPEFFNSIEFHLRNNDVYLCYVVRGDEIAKIMTEKRKYAASSRANMNVFNFSMQDPTYSMYSRYITYEEYNYNVGYWLLKKTNYWLVTLQDYMKNYTGFTFPIRVYPDMYSDKYIEVTTDSNSFTIEMTPSVHRWMNTKKKPCSEGLKSISTNTTCDDLCKAQFRYSLKICLALDFAALLDQDYPTNMCKNEISFLPILFGTEANIQPATSAVHPLVATTDELVTESSIPVVTTELIENPVYIDLEKQYYACGNKCMETCEVWNYEYSMTVTTFVSVIRSSVFKNQTDISIIYPDEDDVLITIEVDSRTWEDFVANVGGLLGVWTGASIVSFLQMFYLCCCTESECNCCSTRLFRQSETEKLPLENPTAPHVFDLKYPKLFKVVNASPV